MGLSLHANKKKNEAYIYITIAREIWILYLMKFQDWFQLSIWHASKPYQAKREKF